MSLPTRNPDKKRFSKENLRNLFRELQEIIYVNKITLENPNIRAAVYQWEAKDENPSIATMVDIGHFFGVNISFLLEHTGRLKDSIDLSRVNKHDYLLSREERNSLLKKIHRRLLRHINAFLEKNLTEEGLDSHLNIHPRLLQEIVKNGGIPRFLTLVKILENLDIDVILFLKQVDLMIQKPENIIKKQQNIKAVDLKKEILTSNGYIRHKYKGMDGYAKFAEDFYGGNMKQAFINVSAVVEKSVFQKLGWQEFFSSLEDFRTLRGKILTPNGDIRHEYKGMDGYANFAEKHYEGNMKKTFLNVSAILKKSLFQNLGWQEFIGLVENFHELRKGILTSNGDIRHEYKGIDGYEKFVKEGYYGSDMLKTFINVSAVVEKSIFKKLGWQGFHDSVEDFRTLRGKILTSNGDIRHEYKGIDGYEKFVKEGYYGSDMLKTFINVSAVVEKSIFKKLGWQAFSGSLEDFRTLRGKILTSNGDIRHEYKGMDGYANFAEKYYEGNMKKTFLNVSAVVEKSVFQKLGWQEFFSSLEDFRTLRGKILTSNGDIRHKYKGMDGYANFAEKYYEGNMKKTFLNVSAVVEKSVFQKLGWQEFIGLVENFHELRKGILTSNGDLRHEYKGMDGYAKLAEDYYEGDMKKAFRNISAILGGSKSMKRLEVNWKLFFGNIVQYKRLILLFEENGMEMFQGRKGQERIANELFEGNTIRTYGNVSILREILFGNKERFSLLNWEDKN